MKNLLLVVGGIVLGGLGVMAWLMWYFRDVMR